MPLAALSLLSQTGDARPPPSGRDDRQDRRGTPLIDKTLYRERSSGLE
jgi:hypothetical protein